MRTRAPLVRWTVRVIASLAMVAVVTGGVLLLRPHVEVLNLLVLYLLAVLPVAIRWGAWLAAFTSIVSISVFVLLIPPVGSLLVADSREVVALAVFLVTAVVAGDLGARSRRSALESARLSEEQSALRRVATLVAESSPQSAIFEAVTREVGVLCGADLARMERYGADGTVTGVAAWSRVPDQLVVGTRFALDGLSVAREVRLAGGPVRLDTFAGATGEIAGEALALGIRSSIGCPIVVAGELWGVIAASTRSEDPYPANVESQIANFTQLVVTAIENAEARTKLTRSRARIVATADETRRRIERDLHDGAQQRLVSLALNLRGAQSTVPADLPELRDSIGQAVVDLQEILEELREISRGIHPAILSEGGLGLALRALARRSAVPVELHVDVATRYPQAVEVAAYYVISEAITNTTKHAKATYAEVTVEERDGAVRLRVRDDGVGGADLRRGSGLIGLHDRVEALAGSIDVSSPAGQGTVIDVALPVDRGTG